MSKPSLDNERDVVEFIVTNNGQQIKCAISFEALDDNFGEDNNDYLNCFISNSESIEGKARDIIRRKQFEPDGSTLIRSVDGR